MFVSFDNNFAFLFLRTGLAWRTVNLCTCDLARTTTASLEMIEVMIACNLALDFMRHKAGTEKRSRLKLDYCIFGVVLRH